MSESDTDAILGRAVRLRNEAKLELEHLMAKAQELGSTLEIIGERLRTVGGNRRSWKDAPTFESVIANPVPTAESIASLLQEIEKQRMRVAQLDDEARRLGG